MRISFVLPADAMGGGIRVLATYALRLAARGHMVTVIQPRHRKATLRETFRSVRRGEGWPKDLNRRPSFFDTMKHENLRRVLLPHAGPVTAPEVPDGDVVLASWWETAEWVWALPASKGVKAHFVQGYEVWGGNLERVEATYRLPMAKIVIAKWLETLMLERYGQRAAAVIGNSVDTGLFTAEARGKQAATTVGFTYSPTPNKGSDLAMAAIERARREEPGLRVISFGLDLPGEKLPAGTQYEQSPKQERLRGLYAECDAWLFASRIEGFGLPILEAMACRTPVIGMPAGAAPELIGKGGGILVGMEDVEGMAAAIVRVARMGEGEWRGMSDAAYATATGYSWEDATDRFEGVLRGVRGEL